MPLQNKKIMPPPWLAYRDIERYSIGWRMGYGEDYIIRFCTWLETLSPQEQIQYRAMFPEPVTWRGWWEEDDTSEILEFGEFLVDLWQPEGTPKYTLSQLRQEAIGGKKHDFCFFFRPYPAREDSVAQNCFSQWYMADFRSIERTFCCMEQYMMASKAELFDDPNIREQILESRDPKQIFDLGRKVRNFDQKLWDRAKYSIVLNGNWCKFSQNKNLRTFLLSTGECVLAEASPYDGIWGIRLPASSPDAQDPMKWQGQNLLGFALMEVRDELRRVNQNELLCDWTGIDFC